MVSAFFQEVHANEAIVVWVGRRRRGLGAEGRTSERMDNVSQGLALRCQESAKTAELSGIIRDDTPVTFHRHPNGIPTTATPCGRELVKQFIAAAISY